MRAVQCYDFESSHAVDKPAFSAIGFMPVLPGPCGLFRYHEVLHLPKNFFYSCTFGVSLDQRFSNRSVLRFRVEGRRGYGYG
jgi:hypothetical protein